MKKKAFLQALVLVLLLLLSWAILIRRFKSPGEPSPRPDETGTLTEPDRNLTRQAPDPIPAPAARVASPIPEGWREWMEFLADSGTGTARIRRIEDLRVTLFSMPVNEATSAILELLDSGYDLPTGDIFASGPEGRLAGASSLREHLLDWLGQLDPGLAATYARSQLAHLGTSMQAGDYVLHLRNFDRGSPEDLAGRRAFLESSFRALLEQPEWMAEPGPAVAEAMDLAVYLGESDLVPSLAGLRAPGQPEVLRHAGDLALERLITEGQLPAVRELLESPEGRSLPPRARAGYVARLDPVDEAGRSLLGDYLADPRTSPVEVADFLAYFPNLNRSLSYNLFSRGISATSPADGTGRLQRALSAVEFWQQDPALQPYGEMLESARKRLTTQLNGIPAP